MVTASPELAGLAAVPAPRIAFGRDGKLYMTTPSGGPDALLYVLVDHENGGVLRIEPAPAH